MSESPTQKPKQVVELLVPSQFCDEKEFGEDKAETPPAALSHATLPSLLGILLMERWTLVAERTPINVVNDAAPRTCETPRYVPSDASVCQREGTEHYKRDGKQGHDTERNFEHPERRSTFA